MSSTPAPGPSQKSIGARHGELELTLPIGTKIQLKFSSDTRETGIVTGHTRGKVIVHWPEWDRKGSYHPWSLIALEDKK